MRRRVNGTHALVLRQRAWRRTARAWELRGLPSLLSADEIGRTRFVVHSPAGCTSAFHPPSLPVGKVEAGTEMIGAACVPADNCVAHLGPRKGPLRNEGHTFVLMLRNRAAGRRRLCRDAATEQMQSLLLGDAGLHGSHDFRVDGPLAQSAGVKCAHAGEQAPFGQGVGDRFLGARQDLLSTKHG